MSDELQEKAETYFNALMESDFELGRALVIHILSTTNSWTLEMLASASSIDDVDFFDKNDTIDD